MRDLRVFPKGTASVAPAGALVVPPQAHTTTVIRTVLAEVIKPVQAQVIHEERVNVEALDVNFRPVYAFEYEWATKAKRVVLEFDGLTGEVHSGGKKQSGQVKGMLTRDLIFDIPTLVATISAGLTLKPGDIIATGTPAGVGLGFNPPKFLRAGDKVAISISHLGTLTNTFQ